MRMIAGAVILVASAVCVAGNEIAQAHNQFEGGPLPFLGWACGLGGAALLFYGLMDDARSRGESQKGELGFRPPDKKKSG
ncbi:MAG: hypothetical protein KY476_19140 [Planctomycetes bacterium]|nr:hypothetical protein [Planctomycetota bacterium]